MDLVEELAFPLPFAVISTMLGMPPTDHVRMRELTGTLVRSLEVVADPEEIQAIMDAEVELPAMTEELIAWKRANPADDLLTALIEAEEDGDGLSDDELVAQVVLLYVAGHETTVNLIANGVVALLRNPDQLALLRARPDLAGNAVEEFLRYDSPVQQTRRITTAPYTVRDKEIPAGAVRHRLPRRGQPGRADAWARTPTSCGSTARTPTATCPSAAARTTAWAPRWPGWRARSPSAGWSPVPGPALDRRRDVERPDQPARRASVPVSAG